MEWLLFCLLIGLGVLIVLGKLRRSPKWTWSLALSGVVGTLLGATYWSRNLEQRSRAREQFAKLIPRQGRPDGYVSSDKCQACHPSQYASWHQTFHRTMTQYATPKSVLGRFDNLKLELRGETYRLERRQDEFWVEMPDPDWKLDPGNAQRAALDNTGKAPRVWKRIGLLTGSHHMQVYWVPSRFGNMQNIFPFVWLTADQHWVPFHDTFLRDPKIPPTTHIWNVNCIKCHSTGGQPRLDPVRRMLDTRAGELGIACEACHGPAAEHARVNQDPLRRFQFHAAKRPESTIVNPARLSPEASSQVCGQCHGIKWIPNSENYTQNGFRYLPGQDLYQTTPIARPARLELQPWLKEPLKQNPRFLEEHYWSDGEVRVSGREYNGLVDSACHERGKLSCLSCHSMHQSEPDDQLARRAETNEDCLQCHDRYREKIQAHTHHPANSNASLCYNCHMPYTTYGLMKAIRTHKISSPRVETSLKTGRPNACNLCHLDKSLGWTSRHLNDWYATPQPKLTAEEETISAALLWLLRGDAGQRALIAWSMGWEPARQASGQGWLVPFLAQLLDDPYSTVRYISYRSLRRLAGYESFDYDFVGSPETRIRAHEQALAKWSSNRTADRTGNEILINPDGTLQQDKVERLLRQRDDRSMDLQE